MRRTWRLAVGFMALSASPACKLNSGSSEGELKMSGRAGNINNIQSTLDAATFINNYAAIDLAPFACTEVDPTSLNECKTFSQTKRGNQQATVDRQFALNEYHNPLDMAPLARRYTVGIRLNSDDCFNLSGTSREKPDLGQGDVSGFLNQIDAINQFVADIHISMRGEPNLSVLVPKAIYICTAPQNIPSSSMEMDVSQQALTIRFAELRSPSEGRRFASFDAKELHRLWHAGAAFAHLGEDRKKILEQLHLQPDPSFFQKAEAAISEATSIVKATTGIGQSRMDQAVDLFTTYWPLLDPLGSLRSGIRLFIDSHRLQLYQQVLRSSQSREEGSLQLQGNDRVRAVKAALKTITPEAETNRDEFEAQVGKINANNLENFLKEWGRLFFSPQVMTSTLNEVEKLVHPCTQDIKTKEKKAIRAIIAVENNHQIGVCIGSNDASMTQRVESERDIRIDSFVAVSTSDIINVNTVVSALTQVRDIIDVVSPWSTVKEAINAVAKQ